MSNEQPPLPHPRVPAVIATAENTESVRKGYEMGGYEKSPPLFDEKQVLAYGRACERAAYERAIVAAEHNASLYPEGSTGWESSVECAQAIRTIKNLSELGKRT